MVKLIPRNIREAPWPKAEPLSDEQYSKYQESIKQFSGKAYDSLDVPRNGSNLFQVLYLNQIGIETPTIDQIGDAVREGMDLSNNYVDARSVVLRSNGDSDYTSNDYVAKNLADKMVRKSFEVPLVLNGLEVEVDDKSDYGLVLTPGDNFEVFEVPDFAHENNGKKFWAINPDYSINWVGEDEDPEGSSDLYTRDNGLSRLFRDR